MKKDNRLLMFAQEPFFWIIVIRSMLNEHEIDRVIEMAWEDRTPFEAIHHQFGLTEQEVIELMRREMKATSFRMWRKRVTNRGTKHAKLRSFQEGRFKCSRQRVISQNKISKR